MIEPTLNQNKKANRFIPNIALALLAIGITAALWGIYNEIHAIFDPSEINNNDQEARSSKWPQLNQTPADSSQSEFNLKPTENGNYSNDFEVPNNHKIKRKSDAQIFAEKGQSEIKSIATHFLTVVISVIMVAITFSEKIIDFKTSNQIIKYVFIMSLLLFVSALISGGIGLAYNSYSYAFAVYSIDGGEPMMEYDFYESAFQGIIYIVFGGVLLVFGMGLIILTAIIQTIRK